MFTYENQGVHSYLVYEVAETEELDSMSLGMITNNKIPGVAAASYTQIDNKKFIRYNISSKVSAKQFFEGVIRRKQLINIFSNIIEAIKSADDYMLAPESFVLDLSYIFIDVSTYEVSLVCLPIEDTKNGVEDLGIFFKQIMFSLRFDQTENSEYVGKIINYLNSMQSFSMDDFEKLLGEFASGTTQPTVMSAKPVSVPKDVPENNQGLKPVTMQQTVAPMANIPPVILADQKQPYLSAPSQQPEVVELTEPQVVKKGKFSLFSQRSKEASPKKNEKENVIPVAKESKKQKKKNQQAVAYAIPSQNTSFAVPGQPTPALQAATPQAKTPVVPVGKDAAPAPQTVQPQAPISAPVMAPSPASMSAGGGFGETTVLGISNNGETTVLSANMMQQAQRKPYLLRTKNNEKILVDKVVFRIGKEKSYVDYFIADNTAVSRSHANIITRDGAYFVMDTNSTNHTYVNGGMLQSNVETKISHGTKIRLANEDFEFKLY